MRRPRLREMATLDSRMREERPPGAAGREAIRIIGHLAGGGGHMLERVGVDRGGVDRG
jgi:hypothetical protein